MVQKRTDVGMVNKSYLGDRQQKLGLKVDWKDEEKIPKLVSQAAQASSFQI